MGSPISGLITEAVLQWLERLIFAVIAPKFWERCVDYTFVIIKKDQVLSFHQLLNIWNRVYNGGTKKCVITLPRCVTFGGL